MTKVDFKKVDFKIEGMHCAACASSVEKAVSKLDGIETVSVNLPLEKMSIYGDTPTETVISSVENLGFTASILNKDHSLESVFDNKINSYRLLLKKFIISGIFAVPLFLISMQHMLPFVEFIMPNFLNPAINPQSFALAQLILTLPILVCGKDFYISGIPAIFRKVPNMDSLVSIGTLAAIIYSLYNTLLIFTTDPSFAHNLYFESGGIIITLVLLGKTLESRSKGKTSKAIESLIKLAPQKGNVISNLESMSTEEKLVGDIEIGDLVSVKPGERIPVDGKIFQGKAFVDQSSLTGESVPLSLCEQDDVFRGTLNLDGYILIKVTKLSKDSTMSKILELVEEAQTSKVPMARIADRVASYFVPIVFLIATVTFFVWLFLGEGLSFALTAFISVLVISCPCALGLATPIAIMVSTGNSALKGILIKDGESLELASKVTTIALDKTGTVTEGNLSLNKIEVSKESPIKEENTLLALAASIERGSSHPLGVALIKKAEELNLPFSSFKDFLSMPGYGLVASIDSKTILLGNRKAMELNNVKTESMNPKEESCTTIYMAIDGVFSATFFLTDTIKESSINGISQLKELGKKIIMVTGDNKGSSLPVGETLGISKVYAGLLPEEKAKVIEDFKGRGEIVMMVGDGINDAPSLVTSNVGVAIGSGTHIAIESAKVVLVKNSIEDVSSLIRLSKATLRNIKQNLFWAFIYNIIGIPIAAGVLHIFGGPLLNPMIAAAAMSLSSLSVVLNALRLKNIS